MIATFAIEVALAIYVAVRQPSSLFRAIVITILLCLASFQLAEFEVCLGPESTKLAWTKFGLVGITLLPALGMHLIALVTTRNVLIPVSYTIAGSYAAMFLFLPGTTEQALCCGNYVLLNIDNGWVGRVYDLYYTVFVVLAMVELGMRLLAKVPITESGYSSKLIGLTLLGYLSFTVPMAIVAVISAQLRDATPSIMCGFAVILAFILALILSPLYASESAAIRLRAAPDHALA